LLSENLGDLENTLRYFFDLGLLEESSKAMRVLKLLTLAVTASARKKLIDAVNEKWGWLVLSVILNY